MYTEEAERRKPQDCGVRTELQPGEQHRSALANVYRATPIGRAPEVAAEVGNTVQVCSDGCIGELAAAQLFKQEPTWFSDRIKMYLCSHFFSGGNPNRSSGPPALAKASHPSNVGTKCLDSVYQ
jgi:hypothetical protein